MFERFTERARQVVVLAQDEARALKHNYIGTEHILLGLLREEEGLAARVLEQLDITVEEVRAQVARIVGQGDEVTTGQIPFTPRATTHKGRPQARRWSCAAAHGSTRPLTSGRPNAPGSLPTGGMRTSAYGVCRRHDGRRKEWTVAAAIRHQHARRHAAVGRRRYPAGSC